MPPIESQTDAPLAAVAALARAAVHSDIDPSVLLAVYQDPRDLAAIAGNRLPALAIYRHEEKRRHIHSGIYVRDITVRFDYVATAITPDNRGVRWPLLQSVWNSIADAMIAGKHSAASGGALVLCAAGVEVEHESPKAQYTFATGGEEYPFFRGEMVAVFTPADVDAATLDDFLTHYTSWDEPGEVDHDTPLADDSTTLPAYGS